MRPLRVNLNNKKARPADHSDSIYYRLVDYGKLISVVDLTTLIFGSMFTTKQKDVVTNAIAKLVKNKRIVRVKRKYGLQSWVKEQ